MDGVGRSNPNIHAHQAQSTQKTEPSRAEFITKTIKAFTQFAPDICKEIKGLVKGTKALGQMVQKDAKALQDAAHEAGQNPTPENLARVDTLEQKYDMDIRRFESSKTQLRMQINYCKKITQSVVNTKDAMSSVIDQIKKNI